MSPEEVSRALLRPAKMDDELQMALVKIVWETHSGDTLWQTYIAGEMVMDS